MKDFLRENGVKVIFLIILFIVTMTAMFIDQKIVAACLGILDVVAGAIVGYGYGKNTKNKDDKKEN